MKKKATRGSGGEKTWVRLRRTEQAQQPERQGREPGPRLLSFWPPVSFA